MAARVMAARAVTAVTPTLEDEMVRPGNPARLIEETH
jgi:hypothetical protein